MIFFTGTEKNPKIYMELEKTLNSQFIPGWKKYGKDCYSRFLESYDDYFKKYGTHSACIFLYQYQCGSNLTSTHTQETCIYLPGQKLDPQKSKTSI